MVTLWTEYRLSTSLFSSTDVSSLTDAEDTDTDIRRAVVDDAVDMTRAKVTNGAVIRRANVATDATIWRNSSDNVSAPRRRSPLPTTATRKSSMWKIEWSRVKTWNPKSRSPVFQRR